MSDLVPTQRVPDSDEDNDVPIVAPKRRRAETPLSSVESEPANVTPAAIVEVEDEPPLPVEPELVELQRRVRAYAALSVRRERFVAAHLLLPALARHFANIGEFDLTLAFSVYARTPAEIDALNEPFRDPGVWRDAFRRAFADYVRHFGDMLPDFYRVDESERTQVLAWRQAQDDPYALGYGTPEPLHGAWRQWRHYFLLVYDLFVQMRMLTVVALRKAPTGVWNEYYEQQMEVTSALMIDRPEQAIFVLPEQFGVIGDVHDIALSTFRPTYERGADHSTVQRWFSVPFGELEPSAKTAPPGVLQTASPDTGTGNGARLERISATRRFIESVPEQFARTRADLRLDGVQWWVYERGNDAIAMEYVPLGQVNGRHRQLGARIAEQTAIIEGAHSARDALRRAQRAADAARSDEHQQQQQRRQRRLEPPAMRRGGSITTSADDDDDEEEDVDRLPLPRTRLRELEIATRNAEADAFKATEQLQQLKEEDANLELARVFHRAVLQLAYYDIAPVPLAPRGAPLKATSFLLLREREPARPDMTPSPLRPLPLPSVDTRRSPPQLGAVNDGDDDDDVAEEESSAARDSTVTHSVRRLDERTTFQVKATVLLTHTLRYFVGWVDASNSERSGAANALEYVDNFDYVNFTESGVFESKRIAVFVVWLMGHHARQRRDASRDERADAERAADAQAMDIRGWPPSTPPRSPIIEGSDNGGDASRSLEADVNRIELLVQQRAFPFLATEAREATSDDNADDDDNGSASV